MQWSKLCTLSIDPPLTVRVCVLTAHHITWTLGGEHHCCDAALEMLFLTGSRDQKEKVSQENHGAHTMSRNLVSTFCAPCNELSSCITTAPLSIGHPAAAFSTRAHPHCQCSLQGSATPALMGSQQSREHVNICTHVCHGIP